MNILVSNQIKFGTFHLRCEIDVALLFRSIVMKQYNNNNKEHTKKLPPLNMSKDDAQNFVRQTRKKKVK